MPAQTCVWNDLPCTVFNTGTLDGFKGTANRWLLPELCFFSFPWRRCFLGCESNLENNFVFPTWACAAGFNNNDICLDP